VRITSENVGSRPSVARNITRVLVVMTNKKTTISTPRASATSDVFYAGTMISHYPQPAERAVRGLPGTFASRVKCTTTPKTRIATIATIAASAGSGRDWASTISIVKNAILVGRWTRKNRIPADPATLTAIAPFAKNIWLQQPKAYTCSIVHMQSTRNASTDTSRPETLHARYARRAS